MGNQMREYTKPVMNVERFHLNDMVATCPTTATYNPVTVNCIITQSHEVFYTGCSSNYSDMTIVEVENAISFESNMDAINYLSGGSYKLGNGYTLAAGSYLVWATTETGTGGGHGGPGGGSSTTTTYHAGLVSPDITKTVNSSL